MSEIVQNTLYLMTQGTYVSRDHLTLQVEVPGGEAGGAKRRLSVPIHHLESICLFGPSTVSSGALELCWENGVAVNYLGENGYLQARLVGIADTSVTLRRAQFRAADEPRCAACIASNIVAGKLQNSRQSLLRGARENERSEEAATLRGAAAALAEQLAGLDRAGEPGCPVPSLDSIRGAEGLAAQRYFSVFSLTLKRQREAFAFVSRSRRPPRDRINCLLSFLYALLRHDCVAALSSVGLDPFVGFLHADRPNRPGLALDLMEEFRPWLADRLALTLINRQQIVPSDFVLRDGGAVELTDSGRRALVQAYQQRKLEEITHPLLEQTFRIGQMPFVQARVLARHLRGDLADYVPLVPK